MVDAIQAEFDKLNDESRIYPPSGSRVIVKFVLNSDGAISRIISVDGNAPKTAMLISTSALTVPAPYGQWTEDMKAQLGQEQVMTFDFYYR